MSAKLFGYIYLHGFASSPGSHKATIFRNKFTEQGFALNVPDLEGGDFQNMTLTKQIKIVEEIIDKSPGTSFVLIGSSMGGYLSALTAQLREQVCGLYLMAPGFNFLKRWSDRLGYSVDRHDRFEELISVYHYRYNEDRYLSKEIFRDAVCWEKVDLDRELPCRIVHGINDETIPLAQSRDFVRQHPWCELAELDSDHGLASKVDWIVEDCIKFISDRGFVGSGA
jgi:pimeloyl-ACP methyl ester carboxylesterase